jgi:transposase-like protein
MGGAMVCSVPDVVSATRGDDERARVAVDHSTLNHWVIKYVPELEKQFRRRQSPVGRSWQMGESVPRTHSQSTGMRCYMEDEGRPLGAGVQAPAPNRLKLQR